MAFLQYMLDHAYLMTLELLKLEYLEAFRLMRNTTPTPYRYFLTNKQHQYTTDHSLDLGDSANYGRQKKFFTLALGLNLSNIACIYIETKCWGGMLAYGNFFPANLQVAWSTILVNTNRAMMLVFFGGKQSFVIMRVNNAQDRTRTTILEIVVLFLWRNLGHVVDVTSRGGQDQLLSDHASKVVGPRTQREEISRAQASCCTNFGRPAFFGSQCRRLYKGTT